MSRHVRGAPGDLGWLSVQAGELRVAIRVTPRASRSDVRGVESEADGASLLAVRVTAPPDGGQANAAVLTLLAKRWRVTASRLRIARGMTSRRKILAIAAGDADLAATIEAFESGGKSGGGDG